MKNLLLPMFLLGAGATDQLMAETLPLSCPDQIKTEQKAKTPPAGWETSNTWSDLLPDNGHALNGVGFYSGPPNEGALLAPDQTKTRGKKFTSTWYLPPVKEKYWFACTYDQTTVVLTKQLPDRPLRCEFSYSGDSLVPVKLICNIVDTARKR